MSGIINFTLFTFLAVQIINAKADFVFSSGDKAADIVTYCNAIPALTDLTINEYYSLADETNTVLIGNIEKHINSLQQEAALLKDEVQAYIQESNNVDDYDCLTLLEDVVDTLDSAYQKFLSEIVSTEPICEDHMVNFVLNVLLPPVQNLQNMCARLLPYIEKRDKLN